MVLKFKVDENLPKEIRDLLGEWGQNCETVHDEQLSGSLDPELYSHCLNEGRILITLDRGFSGVRTYPPRDSHSLLVLRLGKQGKTHVISAFRCALPRLLSSPPTGQLWIVEEGRIRIRSDP